MRRIVGLALVFGALAWGQMAQAVPVTYDVNFTGSGTIPTGTLTLDSADIDPLMTVSFSNMSTAPTYSFDDTVSVWTNDDGLSSDPTVTFDASGIPTVLSLVVMDDFSPSGNGRILSLFSSSSWRSTEAGASNTGTYSIAVVPEPSTGLLLGVGLAAVSRRRSNRPTSAV